MFIKITKVVEFDNNPGCDVATPAKYLEAYIDIDKLVGVNLTESIFVPKDCVELVFPGENYIVRVEEFKRKIKPNIKIIDI